MKIKLQTMLKHKLQWLLLLVVLLGVNQGVFGDKGFNNTGMWNVKYYISGSDTWAEARDNGGTYGFGVVTNLYLKGGWVKTWSNGGWTQSKMEITVGSNTITVNKSSVTGDQTWDFTCDYSLITIAGNTPGNKDVTITYELDDYVTAYGHLTFTIPGYSKSSSADHSMGSVVVGSQASVSNWGTETHYGDTDNFTSSSTNTTDFTLSVTDADTYSLTFNPKSTGSKSTTITITDKYGKTYQRTFTGTGTAIGNPSNATLSFSGSTATIGWMRNSSSYKKVMVVRYESPNLTPTTPSNGATYTAGSSTIGNGRVIYNGNCESASSSIENTVTPGKTYVYYIYTNNGNCYSSGINTGSVCCPPLEGFAIDATFNNAAGSPWEGSQGTGVGEDAATGGYFNDANRYVVLETSQIANYYQWYECDADGSNPRTTLSNATWDSGTSDESMVSADYELPGTYYYLCKAGCSSADVASSVVQVDVPYPEFGISGPFFDGGWNHEDAGDEGLFSHREGTNIWTKTFNCDTPTGAFVIIQQYKKGATCHSGWVGDDECGTGKNNKMNGGTITLTGISQASSGADFYKNIECMPAGSSVTLTLSMTAHDTYDISLARTKSAPEHIYLKGKIWGDDWGSWHELTKVGNVYTISFNAHENGGESNNREFVLSTMEDDKGKLQVCLDAIRAGWEYIDDEDHTSNFRATSTVVPSNDTPITIKVMYNEASDDFTMVITKQCSALNTAHASTSLLLDEYSENVLCPGENAKATMVSRKGYTYELFNGATSYGSNAGSGTTVSWKNLSDAGTYYVMATKNDDATCTGIVGSASQTINSSVVNVSASPSTSVVDFRPITLTKDASSTVDTDLTWAVTSGTDGYLLLPSSKLPYDERQRKSVIFKGGPYGDTPSRAYTVTATGKKTVNIGDTDDKKTCESTATVNITLTAVPGCD